MQTNTNCNVDIFTANLEAPHPDQVSTDLAILDDRVFGMANLVDEAVGKISELGKEEEVSEIDFDEFFTDE
jgi:hypothetical protein